MKPREPEKKWEVQRPANTDELQRKSWKKWIALSSHETQEAAERAALTYPLGTVRVETVLFYSVAI